MNVTRDSLTTVYRDSQSMALGRSQTETSMRLSIFWTFFLAFPFDYAFGQSVNRFPPFLIHDSYRYAVPQPSTLSIP